MELLLPINFRTMRTHFKLGILLILSLTSCVKPLADTGVIKWDLSSLDLPQMTYNGKTYYIHPDAGEMTYQEALSYCERLNAYEHQDWFLPDKQELSEMFTQAASLGGFQNAAYWFENPYSDKDSERNLSYNGGSLSAGKGRVRPVRCDNSFSPSITLKQINEGNWTTFEITVPQSSRYTIKRSGLCWSEKANADSRNTIVESSKKDGTFQLSVDKADVYLKTMYLSAFSELSDGKIIYSNEITLIPHKPNVDFSLVKNTKNNVKAVIDIKDWGFPENFNYIEVWLSDNKGSLTNGKRLDIKEDIYHYEEIWDMTDGTLYLIFNPYSKSDINVPATFSASLNQERATPQVRTLPVTNKTSCEIEENTNIVYSMSLNFELLEKGYPEVTSCGIVLSSTNPTPSIEENDKILTQEKTIASYLTENTYSFADFKLIPSGPVYIRAYAENDVGVSYGDVITVNFIEPAVASVTTSNITTSFATLTSSILEAGDPQYTEKGFIYLTKKEYDSNKNLIFQNMHKSPTPNNQITGEWNMQISDLYSGTEYVALSYCQEGELIWHSDDVKLFKTCPIPEVVTLPVSWEQQSGGKYALIFNGTINNHEETHYIERGFILASDAWNLENDYNTTIITIPYNSSADFSYQSPELWWSTSTKFYWVRTYAKTDDGKMYYGNELMY